METYHCMFLVFCLALHASQGKIYTIDLKNQAKDVIPLSTFGYLPGGSLEVNITSLKLAEHESPTSAFKKVGLRIDKSSSGGRSDFMEGKCPVTEYTSLFNDEPELSRAVLTFIFENETKPTLYLQVCSHNFSDLHFFSNEFNYDSDSASEPIHHNAACVATTTRKQRDVENSLPVALNKDGWFLSTSLYFKIDNENQAGLYEIYLHNCDPNSHIQTGEIHIIEQNDGTYLSAGEIALPTMYGIMAMFIFITAFFWVGVLWKNRSKVFTIHYLMALLMFIKALSITFHAIDYHFIGRDGMQEAWAVIFYIVHL
ncbi:unnamed protein product [Clavelina lepadiformis]|uniref:GOST seven transmembrane domain-containing protein n=1 Tax=Clavelina lepadiformis TaxID=159417 RepID=A0ABP0F2Y2_CLALP